LEIVGGVLCGRDVSISTVFAGGEAIEGLHAQALREAEALGEQRLDRPRPLGGRPARVTVDRRARRTVVVDAPLPLGASKVEGSETIGGLGAEVALAQRADLGGVGARGAQLCFLAGEPQRGGRGVARFARRIGKLALELRDALLAFLWRERGIRAHAALREGDEGRRFLLAEQSLGVSLAEDVAA
jgi:hypothetical protein